MTQIGRYKDEPTSRWTTAQAAHVQHVVDNSTFNFALLAGDITLRFVRGLGSVNGNQTWGQRLGGRVLAVRKDLSANETRYTIMHETGHQVDIDLMSLADRLAFQALLLPPGAYGNTAADWKDGPYAWKASEGFADDFAKIYAGAGASWKNILEGNNPPDSRFYRRSVADIASAKTLIEVGVGGDPDDPGDPDPFFPVAISFDTLKDLSRRKKVGGTQKQGSGGEHHLPLGFLDVTGSNADYIYDALVQLDIAWPEDAERIINANLEVTVVYGPAEHISGSGDRSFMRGQRVLQSWNEGNNAEDTWDDSDWANPTIATNVASLGTVGSVITGTRLSFPIMDLIKKWAPARISIEGKGPGENQSNFGLLLSMSKVDSINGATMIASSEHPTNAWRPKLYMEYTPTSAKPVALLLGPAGNINTNNFVFTGEYSDPFAQDEMGHVDIEVKKAGGPTVWTPGPRLASANEAALGIFSTASSAQGAPNWVVGQNYQFRARVQSKGSAKWSDWTDWLDFTIVNAAPTVSATSLGSKATLAGVLFGGPFTNPTQPAPVNPIVPLSGLARMTMFDNPGVWATRTVTEQNTAIAKMVEMHQRGVILQCIDWNSPRDHTPGDLTARLDRYIAAGITPYLGVWLKEFGTNVGGFNEQQKTIDAWNAGGGRWGGIIVDVEDAWSDFNRDHHASSVTNINAWTTAVRAVMGGKLLGYTSYGVPGFHNDVDWTLLNSKFDVFLPQIYYSGPNGDGQGDTARILNRAINSINDKGMTKPFVPTVNSWGSDANAANRRQYIDRSLTDYGSVVTWRFPIANSEVRDVFAEFPRDANPTPGGGALSVVNKRIQLRPEAQGNPAWDTDTGTLWDTGQTPMTAPESTSLSVRVPYRGQPLVAGTYTYRVQVQDSLGAWSAWSYATLTLTAPYQPNPGDLNFLSTYRQQSPVRIVIRAMGPNRGPAAVKAIIYDAQHIGASKVANDVGEIYFTIPTMHPQAQEIEPLQRHYALEFYRGGNWMPLFEGVIVDMDATEDEVVFYGLDYIGLLSKNVETAFFTTDQPEKGIDDGGSKYIDKTISYVVKDQLQRGHDQADSPLGFINVEAQGSSTLMEAITSKVTINAAFRERLPFILGLIQSAKQGTGNRSRLWPERLADGSYQWRFKNNAGATRDNLALRYGELIQGFRIVVLGQWAAKVYGVGRITNEIKPRFKSASAPGIDTNIWGNLTMPAVWQDLIDENDLQRRVKQLAMEMGKFGKSVALGLRVSGIEVFDGWDLLDSIPLEIQRGAVDTTRYGSGYWTIQGVEYRLEPDGHDELTLAVKPREDQTAPDPDLIPSHPVSTANEWDRADIIGTNLAATSNVVVRADGTIAAIVNATWDSISEENFDLWGVQVARNGEGDFTDATLYTTPNSEIALQDMLPGEDYSLRVGAYDTMGNFSGYSTYIVATAAVDTTAPPLPTGVTVTPAIRALVISWQAVSATDLDHYEVDYRLNGTSDPFVALRTHSSVIAITGLQANDAGTIKYDIKVRAVDTSENASAFTSVFVAAPLQVTGGDIQANSITTGHIATVGLDASVIKTGYLAIGGAGTSATFVMYNAAGLEVGRIDSSGVLIKDPTNLNRQVRFKDGTMEFTKDGGVTWGTAINADGIRADSILSGHVPGGQNLLPNSSFEMTPFLATVLKVWTLAADWGTTIGTDVLIDKSTGDLKLSSVAY